MKSIRFLLCFCLLFVAFPRAELVLTPQNVTELVLKNNPRLKAAEWSVKESMEARKEAFTGFLPKVSGSASYKRTSGVPGFSLDLDSMPQAGTSDSLAYNAWQMLRSVFDDLSRSMIMGTRDNYSLSLSLSQPIFSGFKILNGYRLAGAEARAEEWERKKSEQVVLYSALSLYWTAYALKNEVDAARDEKEQLSAAAKFQELRYEQKLIARYELLRVRASLAKSNAAVVRAEQRFLSTQRKLLSLLSLDPFTPVMIAPGPSDTSAMENATGLRDYLEQFKNSRPDLQKNREEIDAAVLKKKIAGGDFLPSVSLTADYSYARPNELVSFSDAWQRSWCIGALATWNILDCGAAHFRTKEAEYRLHSLQDAALADEHAFFSQAIDAWEAVAPAKAEFEALREEADAMVSGCSAMELQYRQGEVSTTDYLLARSELTQAISSREYARVKLLLAIENMKIGGLGER